MLKKFLNNQVVKLLMNFVLSFMTDKQVVKLQYRFSVKRKLNIRKPMRFTEKIQWYKLNYKNPLMTICADKYLVRNYIKEKGYSQILVDLYQVVDSFDEINFDLLPEKFIIKSNNGSGTNIIVRDKTKMDISKVKKTIESWRSVNTILYGREWAYKNIEPKIVIEELLEYKDDIKKDINDYKFLVFDGKVHFVWVDIDRSKNHKRSFFDRNWNELDIEVDVPKNKSKIEKPSELLDMIKIAEQIGSDFPFVRVDFYWVNCKIYFGEATFYPWSGCVRFSPDEVDFDFGKLFNLNSIK